ncbi:hypothetical protein BTS2_1306 [Bacillus sp. TS-2]|nr:hypothetical protein BTS2_1306 [Bacillus sp. TS-2]
MNDSIHFQTKIDAELYIFEVQKKCVNKKCANIKVDILDRKSISFVSEVQLPISEEVVYKIKVTVFQKELELFGVIKEKNECNGDGEYQYHFTYFSLSEHFPYHLKIMKLKEAVIKKYQENSLYVRKIAEKELS